MVDVIFADVAQPDQARIVALNAHYFLKNGGHFVISIKASCIDSTAAPEAVFAREVKKLQGTCLTRTTLTCCAPIYLFTETCTSLEMKSFNLLKLPKYFVES